MMMKKATAFTFLFFLTLDFFSVIASVSPLPDLDRLSLASLLIKNENYVRAAGVLSEIKDPHDVQTERYYILKGVLSLKQKHFKKAIQNLLKAEESGVDQKQLIMLNETLIKSYLLLKDFKSALSRLQKNKSNLMRRFSYYQLLASLYFETKKEELGWSTLNLGIDKFPESFALKKQKWFYLFEHNLFEESKKYLLSIVDKSPLTDLDLIKMAYRYRIKGMLKSALVIGEMAWLKSQKNIEVAKELARIHIENKQVVAAASVFETLSMTYPRFRLEASELWRKAGYPAHALNLANLILDENKHLKQKITLALDRSDFVTISALGPLTLRNDLKKNEDIQYTVAYANFMTGRFDYVDRYLKNITRSDLFSKALALRKSSLDCSKEEWSCL